MKYEAEKLESYTGHRDCVYNVTGHSDKNKFISASGDGLLVEWDTRNSDLGKPLAQMKNSIYAVHFEKSQNRVWAAQNFEGLHLIDLANKKEIANLALNKAAVFDIKTYKNLVFVAGGDGVITVIDSELMAFKRHIKSSAKSVRSLSINPVERELAAGFSDNTIRIFDLQTLELKKQINAHRNSVFAVKYSADYQRLLSGSRDAHLKIWNINDNYKLEEQMVAHMFTINHIAVNPPGTLIATCSMDKSIKLWDAHTYKLLKVIDQARHAGHGTSVNRLHWLSDEKFVSASDDRSLSLWKVTQYEP
ncbi:WD40 repeat domain-containing protein [uncultured Arcticibacterium sp.]|uniref:WD40 repeat domain-containing protein n=1 Tax=uncultured Arcticibacterium sp. TaxID=2173042 RepID=UPI0030FC5C76